jgi:hypothetical protein
MDQGWIKDFKFTVDKPNTEAFAPVGGWNDKIDPKAPWQKAPPLVPAWQSDDDLKRAFGIELAKTSNPIDAAGKISGADNTKALWISFHWLHDPITIASRDIYLKTLELSSPALDREQLAAKVLALADEKILSPRMGCVIPTIEAKDRIAALKLYSEILGYTGKVEIDQSTKTFNHNEMTIKLVKAEERKAITIDNAPKSKIENVQHSNSPITLKLVGGIRA